MTVEKILDQLRAYAEQGITHVTDTAGREVESILDPEESIRYAVVGMTEDDGIEIDEIIRQLEKCKQDKLLITDIGIDIVGIKYECLIEPTAVLVNNREVRA